MNPRPSAPMIQKICMEQEADHVLHFTRIENLLSILRHGLMGRDTLAANRISHYTNDNLRLDSVRDAICCSIGWPNYKMFFKFRQVSPPDSFVVIELRNALLWELECAFCQTNAASASVRRVPLLQRKTPEAFRAMFPTSDQERDPSLWKGFPTDPQAEVLVLERIGPAYIKRVHFQNKPCLDNWAGNVGLPIAAVACSYQVGGFSAELNVNNIYFTPRYDYERWLAVAAGGKEDEVHS